ncbi:hypothetical protein FLA_1410 [Filimonas lacunae]|nr:hypothetical protein FLA_1410 [Filimonas lacunae]
MHARWLNTLSFMENAGARKISACEHAEEVSIIQLKHAAEEHRHAYYLKKQITKLEVPFCEGYAAADLLAPVYTRHFLHQLDIQTCKYLKKHFQLSPTGLKYAAYLFVTYAIEVRADMLYPVYQEVLTRNNQKVMVKSIILEEEGHLEEMIKQLEGFAPDWEKYAKDVLAIEEQLYTAWVAVLHQEINRYAIV